MAICVLSLLLTAGVLLGRAWTVSGGSGQAAGPRRNAPPDSAPPAAERDASPRRRAAHASPQRAASDEEGADIVVAQAVSLPPDLPALLVRVIDDTGAPVRDAPVGLSHPNRLDAAQTDAAGVWRTRLPACDGDVYVDVAHAIGGRWYLDARAAVAAGATDVSIRLTEAALVSGTVADPAGEPLPDLELEVVSAGVRVFRARTQERGEFVVRVPLRGSSDLALTGRRDDGTEWGFLEDAPWQGRVAGIRPDASDVVLVARPVPQDGELEVRVVAPDGSPVRGVDVHASRPGAISWRDFQPRPVTDAEGRVRLVGLDRRSVEVCTAWPSERDDLRDLLPSLPLEVVPNGQEITLVLRSGTPVAGVVLREGSPARGALVRVFADADADAADIASGTTDVAGRFRCVVPLDAPRRLRAEASLPVGRPHADPRGAAHGIEPGAVNVRIELH